MTASPRPSARGLSVVCGLMGLTAAAGVVGLARRSIDLGPEVTARLPGRSPEVAAVALGAVVAVPMGAAAVAGGRRAASTADLAVLAGSALIGWIVVQVAVIRAFSWLQPVCAAYGAVVLALGLRLRRSSRT